MTIKSRLYLLLMIFVAIQASGACSDEGKASSSKSGKAVPPTVAKAKLSSDVEYEVSRARLFRTSTIKAFDSRYEALLSNPPRDKYTGWKTKAGSSVETTGIETPRSGMKFAQLLVEFVNIGTASVRLDVSPAEGKGLDLALVLPSGKEIPAWEFLGSGWLPDYASTKEYLSRHGEQISVQVSFEGQLYCELAPGQRVWLALLFALPSGADVPRVRLRVKNTTVDVPRISG